MSRTRKITTDDILDAAERVVARLGAAALSIDAVAQEAGVSKSRVVYDHKSKSGLLEALIERQIGREQERQEAAIKAAADTPHPELFGRIAGAARTLNEVDKAVAMAVCASMSGEQKVQEQIRDWIEADLKAMADGPRPKAALMAYLALGGFCNTEFFSFYRWGEAEKQEILEGIRKIYISFPED